ncbi:hypothetical protein T484DRAFT_1572944, partial [Baffinella frigidus]
CSVCIEGSYSYGGGASCRICPPGYYSREIAAVSVNSCISCPSGWTGSEDRTTCTSCPTGKFSSTSAAQSCTSCQAGATSTDDHTGCICRPGYRSVSGGLVCSPCLAGSYNPTAGASTCTECGEGDFSMHVAAVSPSICLPCPAGLLNIDKTRCDCM